jgi:hypothetical protein
MDFEDGVTVHLSGEELAIYQVGLSALSSLTYHSIDAPDQLEETATAIEEWERAWDDKQVIISEEFRADPKAFWKRIIGAKANLTKAIWGEP